MVGDDGSHNRSYDDNHNYVTFSQHTAVKLTTKGISLLLADIAAFVSSVKLSTTKWSKLTEQFDEMIDVTARETDSL